MLNLIAGVVPFLIMISVIVSFHEYGHYGVARLFRTRVERFSVGFGKVLLRHKDKNGVEWCLSAIPLGGYVKFAGDENITSMMPSKEDLEASRAAITAREGADAVNDYFHFKPLWQRFLIILAGPAANFVLAIFLLSIVSFAVGEQYRKPTVMGFVPGNVAEAAGLKVGDTFLSIDGHKVASDDEARVMIALRAETPTPVEVQRGQQVVRLVLTPKRALLDLGKPNDTVTGGVLGISLGGEVVSRPVNPWEALVMGNAKTWRALDTNLTYISRIFTGKENGDQISGILGMTKATGDVTVAMAKSQLTVYEKSVNMALLFLQFTAMISIGVGFLNLLPVPALDGGHLAFYAYQSVAKKPIPAGIQNAAFRIAIVLVLGLMLFAFWNDMNHMGLSKFIGGLFS
ncbi:RIP metalloprotease [Asticcacaulis sp. 201]|uniref:M50 family metallopeptidase n=1 Tax=Asticcacaulis sp. 201 TaxID=3028787 RepID=UPI002915DB99|nr:RIP metalloprotease [Asticcacaulis sp. 201]MDV6329314.1 RIP metalloprotease [Asticcacaulis sp. 201]